MANWYCMSCSHCRKNAFKIKVNKKDRIMRVRCENCGEPRQIPKEYRLVDE